MALGRLEWLRDFTPLNEAQKQVVKKVVELLDDAVLELFMTGLKFKGSKSELRRKIKRLK